MTRRGFVAVLLLCAGADALACPLCLGACAGALGVDLTQSASVTRIATTIPVLPQ